MPIGQVLCLGGALTVGDDSTLSGYRTYRGALQNALATSGLTLNFIGPNQAAAAAGGADPDHAGYVNASIDATGSSGNNLTDRLASIRASFPSPDLIIIDPPWWDIVNAPTNLASRYNTFIGAVQTGDWLNVKVLMCTAHPASGQTAAQTSGAYAAYGSLNAQIETTRAAASSKRYIADLAALTSGATSSSLTERALWFAQKAPDAQYTEGGLEVASYYGGHLITSYKSIQDFNALWTSNIPRNSNGTMTFPPPGGTGLMDYGVQSVSGGVNRFLQSVAGITPWYWIYCLPGHTASNTCVEIRNGFAAAKRIGGGWEFFFSGSRFGTIGQLWNGRDYVSGTTFPDARSRSGQRSDNLTTWHAPRGNQGFEVWPEDTVPSRGVLSFYGGFNRGLMAAAECFWWGAQCRLALIDPNGVDDRSQSRFLAKCGADFTSTAGGRHYDMYGWPYNVQDGGADAWTRVNWTDWQMISALSIGSGSPASEAHWWDPGSPGPLYGWTPPTPYNNQPTYSLTATQIRANPLPVPPYWEGGVSTGGAASGYLVTDYYLPSGGSRVYLLMQSGADKIAQVMSTAIITSGVLSTFTGGGITFEPLPGAATFPNVSLKLTTVGSLVNVEPKNWSASTSAPVWQTTALPTASAGVAYVAGLSAPAAPAATYSIVSGAPAWLTLNGSTGELGGTPPGGVESVSTVVFRATGSTAVDITLLLRVQTAPVITTTSLPAAVVGSPFLQVLQATGTGPIQWSVTSGTLLAGIQLAGATISGSPTAPGSSSFTVTATGPGGTDTQALTLTAISAGDFPAITTTALASGTVGASYSQTITATGAAPITFGASGLPAGLALNASTGAITGTPTAAGLYIVTISASNSNPPAAAVSFPLRIEAVAAVDVASPWARFTRP